MVETRSRISIKSRSIDSYDFWSVYDLTNQTLSIHQSSLIYDKLVQGMIALYVYSKKDLRILINNVPKLKTRLLDTNELEAIQENLLIMTMKPR